MKPAAATLCALAAPALTACLNEGTAPGDVQPAAYEIVAYEGPLDAQERTGARFTFTPGDDDTAVTLTDAAWTPPEGSGIATGARVFLAYVPESGDPLASGPVQVKGAALVTCADALLLPVDSISTWAAGLARPVWVTTVWRSGRYINMRLRLPVADTPRLFALAALPADTLSERPELWLLHALPPRVDADSTYLRSYYASFDISALWQRPQVKGVDVRVAGNTNVPADTIFTFNKP